MRPMRRLRRLLSAWLLLICMRLLLLQLMQLFHCTNVLLLLEALHSRAGEQQLGRRQPRAASTCKLLQCHLLLLCNPMLL